MRPLFSEAHGAGRGWPFDLFQYSRLTYSIVLGGVLDKYVIDYARRHESIPAVEDFHFSDEDF